MKEGEMNGIYNMQGDKKCDVSTKFLIGKP